MSGSNFTLSTWNRLSRKPLGKWLFSRAVCWKAPYFGTVRPRFIELEPFRCTVRAALRRSVKNHIGTVHAIAMCNMAELAAGTMIEATLPSTHRWIPKGMTVSYLKPAKTGVTATALLSPQTVFDEADDVPIDVSVTDEAGQTVVAATITMWVSPKKT